MILKNVTANWLFINRVDDNGNYRVSFEVTKEQDAELKAALEEVAKANNTSLKDCDWSGSRKEENGVITYSAKASQEITLKDGTKKTVDLPVYNIRAQRFADGEIPSVKNGATVNVSVEPYFAKHKAKKGVMLGLRSIQLLKYELYEGDNPFKDESKDIPFGPEDEGVFE